MGWPRRLVDLGTLTFPSSSMILREGLSVVEELVCWTRGNSSRMWRQWWPCLRDARHYLAGLFSGSRG